MRKFRERGTAAAWLTLLAIVLGGGLIETHSHGGSPHGWLGPVAPSGEHDPSVTASGVDSVESSTCDALDFCHACIAGQREGVLDVSPSTPRSRVVCAESVHTPGALAICGCTARAAAPRGPPTV
ncbi:MAG: hypothetical protein AAGF23_09560 [Acidobacteriota bacterium]